MLLPSELATVGLGTWVTTRLYYDDGPSFGILFLACGAWALVCIASVLPLGLGRFAGTGRFLVRAAGCAAIGAVTQVGRGGVSGPMVAAVALMAGIAMEVIRRVLIRAAGRGGIGLADGFRGALLQAAAIWALHPYVRNAQLGSGDAYYYLLMLADMTKQIHNGVFPVFVGQTEFAFNGNIHAIRTAPFYEHFGALLDCIALGTLKTVSLENLTLLASAGLGVLGAYAALRCYCRDLPWTAAALSVLFILSPGVLAPLYEGDMVATFMAVPFIPWMVLGIAQAADSPDAWAPWILQAAALAGLWWAHSPIAFWSSVLTLGAWLILTVRGGWQWPRILRMLVWASIFGLLSGYVFVSVATLELPAAPYVAQRDQVAGVLESIGESWRASLLPVTGNWALGDMQLGYALMAGSLAGFLGLRRLWSARVLLLGLGAFFLLLMPVPWLTAKLWSLVPGAVIGVTNRWPMQRFYVIMAGLATFAALSGLRRLDARRVRAAVPLAVVMIAGLFWSLREAGRFFAHADAYRHDPKLAAQSLMPENVVLSRYAYEIFNRCPMYFSNAHMDPALETRLLDPRTGEVIADASTPVQGAAADTSKSARVVTLSRRGSGGCFDQEIQVGAGRDAILRFDFLGRCPEGELTVNGPGLWRAYALPSSGADRSFGSGPTNGRVIAIRNAGGATERVQVCFTPRGERWAGPEVFSAFARVSNDDIGATPRVIRLKSLLPFEAEVNSGRPAVLESPRMYIPGYRATVDGHPVDVRRTGNGLVSFPVPAGVSEVRLDYRGGWPLRIAYWLSAGGWLAFAAWTSGFPALDRRMAWIRLAEAVEDAAARRAWRLALPVAVGLGIVACGAWTWRNLRPTPVGPIRMVLRLPLTDSGASEPLLTAGRTGAADVVFVRYLRRGRLSVGHDKWAYGGAVSAPFTVDRSVPQTVEISMTSLDQPAAPGLAPKEAAGPRLSVRWNGREVLNEEVAPYHVKPDELAYGTNLIGATTCGTAFSGEILRVERLRPDHP